MTVPETFEPSS